MHGKHQNWENIDHIYTAALYFRILRQEGFRVSSDIFKKFVDDEGKFGEGLVNDVPDILALYEATHLRLHGDDILDHALAFSSNHLQSISNKLNSPLDELVSHALMQPNWRGLPRLEARNYISIYGKDHSPNITLLKLAKLDFNMLQSLHKEELHELSLWWKEVDFARKLPFARDRIVEGYFWIVGVYFEPQYGLARKILSKVIAMATVIDDVYDAYGTYKELEIFTEAIERFNIVGQWAVTTSVDFSLAQLIRVIILLSTGGTSGGGYEASKYVVIAIHAAILLSHAVLNSLPISWLSFFGQLAAAWNVLGVFILMIVIPTVATERASAKFVFTHFNTENGAGVNSKLYIFILGLLMSQYTLTGYDASAHMSEETKSADKNGPKGIISSIGISIIVGWGYILGITFSVTNIPNLLSKGNDAGGYAIAEIFYQVFKSRYGSGAGGIVCLCIVAVAIFFCGMSSITSNSRMAYAFSRDGAMPLSSLWHKVNKQDVPINAVWLSAFIAFCMALTSLGSLVAFQAMVSIATIGLYIAYALPIFFRVTLARKSFTPGPFNLGSFGVLVGWIAVLWVATISVLFSLPVAYPVTDQTLNYTPVAVGGLVILTVTAWVFSARYWFKGPITNIDD